MENYAGYMAYTDHQVGRLIDSLQASGELDNTLVMYVVGDNGAIPRAAWKGLSANSRACLASNSDWKAPSSGSTRSADQPASRTFRSAGPGQ